MTRKSRLNRLILVGWPGLLFASISVQAETNYSEVTPTAIQPTSSEQTSAPHASASYIRLLEENGDASIASPSDEVAKSLAAENQGVVATSNIDSRSLAPDAKIEPIKLAPLVTPNTIIDGLGTGIRPEDVTNGRLPPAQWLPTGQTREGSWNLQAKPWVPGGFCHQPLYFEDPMLERHGHERFPHLQPLVSGVRFFGTIPVLPYLATLRHPLDDVHTLGAYQPGTPAPKLRYRAHYDPPRSGIKLSQPRPQQRSFRRSQVLGTSLAILVCQQVPSTLETREASEDRLETLG